MPKPPVLEAEFPRPLIESTPNPLSSPPGRTGVGPGLDLGADVASARQFTQEDMARIVDKTVLTPGLWSVSNGGVQNKLGKVATVDAAQDTPSPKRSEENSSRLAVENSPSAGIDNQGCFHVRHVEVTELLEDNTLGLLLHGTSVVGFCSSRAENAGWRVGDQIVEVNGQRIGSFDEFLECFMQAQSEVGLPIDFSVLRREQRHPSGETDEAEDALESFFSATNFLDLAGQLQRKFGTSSDKECRGVSFENEDCGMIRSESMSIMENPYIQALKRRRDELLLSTEGWSGSIGTTGSASLASQLASRKDTGIATLEDALPPAPTRLPGAPKPCGWPFCMADRPHGCRETSAPVHEVQPSPRVDQFDVFDGRCTFRSRLDKASTNTWAIFDVGDKNVLFSASCADTGFLASGSVDPTLPVLSSSARRTTEKENLVEKEVRQENCMGVSSLVKNSGAPGRPQPPSTVSSLNFAQQLVPVGNSH